MVIIPYVVSQENPDGNAPHAALEADAVPAAAPGRTLWIRILLGLAALYAVFTLGAWAQSRSPQPPPTGAFVSGGVGGASPLLVHIAGRVRQPGVYRLPASARVRDAIHQAGGPLSDADINAVNLAAWVEDGTRIEVPKKQNARVVAPAAPINPINPRAVVGDIKDELRQAVAAELRDALAQARAEAGRLSTPPAAPRSATRPRLKTVRAHPQDGVPRATTASGQESPNAAPEYLAQHPINLNTATAAQLESLPDIGPALAAKILAYRHEAKGFKTVEDLDNVPGIGEKKLEKLRPLVLVK